MSILCRIPVIIFAAVFCVAAFAAEAPPPRSLAEVEAALAKAPELRAADMNELHVLLVAYRKDHGANEHDYPLWQKCWSLLLGGPAQAATGAAQLNLYGPPIGDATGHKGAPELSVSTAWGFPTDEELERADLVVLHCYIPWEPANVAKLEEFVSKGGGLVLVHPACIVGSTTVIDSVTALTGLAWEYGYTTFRHGPLDLTVTAPDHSVCLGLPRVMHFMDEAYWPLRGDRTKITVFATSEEASGQGGSAPEPMFWGHEYGKGRVFGCIPGHYTWTFDDPYLRILLLRGMTWAAGESPYRFDSLVLPGASVSE